MGDGHTPTLPSPSEGEGNSDPPSPCIDVCRMNPRTNLCEGCLRTLDEIRKWSTADDDFKRGVLAEIRQREQQIAFD